jgi:predicted nucleic acid-binding Zn ribbon protein
VSPPETPDAPAAECPQCGAALKYVDTEISSGAFRPQAASMPQMPIHYYDCPGCHTCWKLGTKLLPDPIRQILKS